VVDHDSVTGNKPNCHVAVDVDVKGFKTLLVNRLTELDRTLKQDD
jgi:inosine-uridine nucleoside N-ribohydrolase